MKGERERGKGAAVRVIGKRRGKRRGLAVRVMGKGRGKGRGERGKGVEWL